MCVQLPRRCITSLRRWWHIRFNLIRSYQIYSRAWFHPCRRWCIIKFCGFPATTVSSVFSSMGSSSQRARRLQRAPYRRRSYRPLLRSTDFQFNHHDHYPCSTILEERLSCEHSKQRSPVQNVIKSTSFTPQKSTTITHPYIIFSHLRKISSISC